MIAIDGPGDEAIVHRALGALRLRLSVAGPGGHSWVDAHTANPVHAIGNLVAAITRLSDDAESGTTVAVTRMAGGESLTSVPIAAWVDVDVRSVSSHRLTHLREEILRLAHRCIAEEMARHPRGTLTLQITVFGERPAGGISEHETLVRAAMAATEASGRAPRHAIASTDANIPLARGIPPLPSVPEARVVAPTPSTSGTTIRMATWGLSDWSGWCSHWPRRNAFLYDRCIRLRRIVSQSRTILSRSSRTPPLRVMSRRTARAAQPRDVPVHIARAIGP